MTTSNANLPRVLAPFAVRQYRWLVAGLAFALFSDGVWLIAVVWQVVALDGGPSKVSMVSGMAAVAMVASTLLGGVLADRVPQRSIIIGLETLKLALFVVVGAASISGHLTFPMLLAASFAAGVTTGMYYPAYSALLPRIVHANQLLAANGVEGVMRPVLYQAIGPMLAGVIIAQTSPGAAIIAGGIASALAGLCYVVMGHVTDEDDEHLDGEHEPQHVARDLLDGFRYMATTPWLWASLCFFSLLLLLIMGPLEVLVPFALRERVGGGPSSHSLVLAAFGVGAALSALVFASFPMPRRYMSLQFFLWTLSALPLVLMGFANHTAWFVVAGFLVGALLDGPAVLWGTLLQRRTPKHMLGRISALDFFVSAALMPASMALAAPVHHLIGFTWTFVLAGLLPIPFAILFYCAGRLWRDEEDHPIEDVVEEEVPLAS